MHKKENSEQFLAWYKMELFKDNVGKGAIAKEMGTIKQI